MFRLEFTLSFEKASENSLKMLLIPDFDHSEKIGKAVIK